MKSIPRAILCMTGLLFGCFLFLFSMPIKRDVNIVGWEYNTTRNTSQYVLGDTISSLIMPEQVCDQKSLLIIMVCSAPGNFEERNAIRDTWGSEQYILQNNLLLYFLIGQTANSTVQNEVLLESDQYGDIVQESFIDSYNNLTLKTVVMLKLVTSYCSNTTKYLLKIDDDMFVNVPLLVEMLMNRKDVENTLIGKLICGARPIKDTTSKWYCPTYMYQARVYPNYLSGTGYVMSLDVAKKLYNTALSTPIFHLEDVYLTGICARKAHVKPQNHPMFTYEQLQNEPCNFRNLITMHHFPPQLLRDTFETMKDRDLATKCKKFKPAWSSQKWLLHNVMKPNQTHRKRDCN